MEKVNEKQSSTEDIGDRMKEYEKYPNRLIPPYLSFVMRLDGKSFSKYTHSGHRNNFKDINSEPSNKGFKTPFDNLFVIAMVRTMNDLAESFPDVTTAYCHSDEISLYFPAVCTKEEFENEENKNKFNHSFGGQVWKFISTSAGTCSVSFLEHIRQLININKHRYDEDFVNKIMTQRITFDSRVSVFPEDRPEDIANYFVWRSVKDCHRNAVSTYARDKCGKRALDNKHSGEMIEMMKELGLDWENQVPIYLKYGVYCKKELYHKKLKPQIEGKSVEVCIRRRLVNRCFKINYYEPLIKLMKDKYWSEDLSQFEVDFFTIDTKNDGHINVSKESHLKN
jgi:tRNA(His) guanylyltransferase